MNRFTAHVALAATVLPSGLLNLFFPSPYGRLLAFGVAPVAGFVLGGMVPRGQLRPLPTNGILARLSRRFLSDG